MATINCPACSAEIQDTARFCRACGRPLNTSEATTKLFDDPAQAGSPTQDINAVPTTPSYSPPSFPEYYQSPLPAAPSTQGLEAKSHKRVVIVLASLVVVLLMALAGLGAWFIFGGGDRGGPPGLGDIPGPPPPRPPPPGNPPVAPGSGGAAISRDLIYPGAREAMRMEQDSGVKMLQLRTSDPMTKVVDWYLQRLNTTKRVDIPGISTILKANGINVIITGADGETQILINQGGE